VLELFKRGETNIIFSIYESNDKTVGSQVVVFYGLKLPNYVHMKRTEARRAGKKQKLSYKDILTYPGKGDRTENCPNNSKCYAERRDCQC